MYSSKNHNLQINWSMFIFITTSTITLLLSKFTYQQDLNPWIQITNPRLMNAYIALHAWKLSIISDPYKFTANWHGPNVCNYSGVYCAPAPDDPATLTVAVIDLNHANIAGILPEELGLLKDLAIFHLNTNQFFGTLPKSFVHLHLLYELDVSNNLLGGLFPSVVLCLPSLIYLDIRFNKFEGEIPPQLFELKLDALFINNNKFFSTLPDNFGDSPVSVFVSANNLITGCIPPSLAKMVKTLNEIVLSNMELTGCFIEEIGFLKELNVLDVSYNMLKGPLPESIGQLKNLEQLNVAHNKLTGEIPESICELPKLENFVFSYNYFSTEPRTCLRLPGIDDRGNCIPGRPLQRSPGECWFVYAHPVNCAFIPCL